MFDTDDNLDYNEVHKKITTIPGLVSWFHYLQSSYILIRDSTSYELTQELIKIIPNKRFPIFRVDLETGNGWMPKEAWEWIENKAREINFL